MEAQTVAAFATDEVYGTEDQQPSTILVVNELTVPKSMVRRILTSCGRPP
jgi:hypothetical protein